MNHSEMNEMDMQEAERLAREARNAYKRKWYAEHKEERKAYYQKWKAKHKEEFDAYQRKYREEHKEEHKKWVQENRERYNDRQKAWRAANPDKVAAIRARYWAKKALKLSNKSTEEGAK